MPTSFDLPCRVPDGRPPGRGDEEAPPAMREWAVKLEAKPKYVVSSTRADFPWTNSHHKVLRPERQLVRIYGDDYSANLVTTLVPESLTGDERVPPGIRDGTVSNNWTYIKIPLP